MSQAEFKARRDLILAEYFGRVHPIYLEYLGKDEKIQDYEAFRAEIHPHLTWAINQVAQLRARLREGKEKEA